MSILIKGMEMPKNCFECPWRCKVDPENLLCRISGEYFEETFSTIEGRHKSCPLVHVPPHGRLGDLDALYKLFFEKAKENKNVGGIMVAMAALCIANAPTIIEAEGISKTENTTQKMRVDEEENHG